MNPTNVLRVADAIEREPERFDLDQYARDADRMPVFGRSEKLDDCRTVACFAGWASILMPPEERVSHRLNAQRFFEIDEGTFEKLCFPGCRDARGHNPYDATATEAARVLRHLAATSEVDWSKAFNP